MHKEKRSPEFNATGASIIALLFSVLFTLSACTTTTPPPPPEENASYAFTEGVPGGVIIDTIEVSAKVTAIDTANRKVTLMGPDGEEQTVKVGPEAINFDQVMVGDMLNVTLTTELVVFLDEEGASGPDGSVAVIAAAPKGGQPAGLVAETTQATATVTGIDLANYTATVQFEDGSSQTLPVRGDIDLSKRKVGEKVVFQSTEMIAISVEKP